MDSLLPNQSYNKDTGKNEYECMLCNVKQSVFSVNFYSGKYVICHGCQIDLSINACKQKLGESK